MSMGPFRTLSIDYFQLGSSNDSTCESATYVRITNINSGTAYDFKVRTTANDDATTTAKTIIGPGESFILKKDPAEFIHGASSNIYASPISPRE
jgi:hypothetical protein|tara:strand:- start:588 stop:869 length:282 start_codon:yes stop_codon:yes gene_type:complete